MKTLAMTLCVLATWSLAAAEIPEGTWVKREGGVRMTMTVERSAGATRITYRMLGADGKPMNNMVMVVVTQLDGKESPVLLNGKPSAETMAIRQVDSHHTATVLKMDGKLFGTSKAELSTDGKTLTVENDISFAAYNQQVGKTTEHWDRR